jgi:hypothetical protein
MPISNSDARRVTIPVREVNMSSSSGRRTRRALAFSASALSAVLVGMKLLSRRTYDATNPRSRANGYLLSHTVNVPRSPREVFDLDEIPSGTRLMQTIVIEMPNVLVKFITDVMGGRRADNLWQRHLVEELESLKAAIEHDRPSLTKDGNVTDISISTTRRLEGPAVRIARGEDGHTG